MTTKSLDEVDLCRHIARVHHSRRVAIRAACILVAIGAGLAVALILATAK